MTYVLAATHETALRLGELILSGQLPPMASDLDTALALRQLHPAPLRYGLAIYLAKTAFGRSRAVSVALVRPSGLTEAVDAVCKAA